MIPFTCAGVSFGFLFSINAATPAMCGVAILVPLRVMKMPAGSTVGPRLVPVARHELILTPGAVTSGFARPSGVGPRLEKPAMLSDLSLAATVITDRAIPGQRRWVSNPP